MFSNPLRRSLGQEELVKAEGESSADRILETAHARLATYTSVLVSNFEDEGNEGRSLGLISLRQVSQVMIPKKMQDC